MRNVLWMVALMATVLSGWAEPTPVAIFSATNYVQDGLVAQWDGIENAGLGFHDDAATTWTDIAPAKKGGDFTLGEQASFTANALGIVKCVSGEYLTASMGLKAMTIEVVAVRTNGTLSIHRWIAPTTSKYDTTFESWSNENDGMLERIGSTRLKTTKVTNNKRITFVTRYDVGGLHTFQTTMNGTTTIGAKSTDADAMSTGNRAIPSQLEFFYNNEHVLVHAVRIYNRRLTDLELLYNRRVDSARFDKAAPAAAELEPNGYIESNGRQIFDTGYKMTARSRIEIDFALTSYAIQDRICGNDSVESYFRTSIYVNGSNKFAFSCGDSFNGVVLRDADTKRHTAIMDAATKDYILITDATTNTAKSAQSVTRTAENSHTLFARYLADGGIGYAAKMKLYACRIYENGQLVRDYVPCATNGNIGCLYDRVNGTLTGSATTTPFSWGGDVPQLEGDGCLIGEGYANQFINTRHRVGPDTRVELDFSLLQKDFQIRPFCAIRGGNPNQTAFYVNGSGKFTFASGDTFAAQPSSVGADYVRHTAILDIAGSKGYLLTAGITNATVTITNLSTQVSVDPLGVFGSTTSSNGVVGSFPVAMRLYGLKIYEAGELAHDYVPWIRGDVAGLKDLVDGRFLASEGRPFTTAGTVPAEAGDAYIESDGGRIINTGYKAKPSTRIEFDGNFLSAAKQQDSLFGYDEGGGLNVRTYINTSDCWAWTCQDDTPNWTGTSIAKARLTPRRLYVLDVANSRLSMITSGFTNHTVEITQPHITESAQAMALLGRNTNGKWQNGACARLYRCRIYEDDVLVRDYAPYVSNYVVGVRDMVTGSFLQDQAKKLAFTAGGPIAHDDGSGDAYLESTGVQGIGTGCFMTPVSKIELDYALNSVTNKQARIFGASWDTTSQGGSNPQLYTSLYLTDDGHLAFGLGNPCIGKWSDHTGDLARHRAVLDVKNKKAYYYAPDGTVKQTMSISATCTNPSVHQLGVFADSGSPDATLWRRSAEMKVFALRIYENDVLAHEFLPGCVNGVNGLYDTKTGEFRTDSLDSGVPFRLSGAGVSGAGASFVVQPQSGRVPLAGTYELKAFAAGATSYQWYCNGEVIEGATLSTCPVEWRKQSEGDTYSVKAFFSVNNETLESTSDAVTVTYAARGMVIMIR